MSSHAACGFHHIGKMQQVRNHDGEEAEKGIGGLDGEKRMLVDGAFIPPLDLRPEASMKCWRTAAGASLNHDWAKSLPARARGASSGCRDAVLLDHDEFGKFDALSCAFIATQIKNAIDSFTRSLAYTFEINPRRVQHNRASSDTEVRGWTMGQ